MAQGAAARAGVQRAEWDVVLGSGPFAKRFHVATKGAVRQRHRRAWVVGAGHACRIGGAAALVATSAAECALPVCFSNIGPCFALSRRLGLRPPPCAGEVVGMRCEAACVAWLLWVQVQGVLRYRRPPRDGDEGGVCGGGGGRRASEPHGKPSALCRRTAHPSRGQPECVSRLPVANSRWCPGPYLESGHLESSII
eukprot:scaffold323_cov94-Isochrysis_galbana.AAC.5